MFLACFQLAAAVAFWQSRFAIGSRPVPVEVLATLRACARDENVRVGLEALYVFGTPAVAPGGSARHELLRTSAADLAAMMGASDPALRHAALRVIGRLFERRAQDDAVDPILGDGVITALNDKNRRVRGAAMQTLAAMRYERAADERIGVDVPDVLGLAGDPDALSIVERLMKDTEPRVALAAERAGARLRAARGGRES